MKMKEENHLNDVMDNENEEITKRLKELIGQFHQLAEKSTKTLRAIDNAKSMDIEECQTRNLYEEAINSSVKEKECLKGILDLLYEKQKEKFARVFQKNGDQRCSSRDELLLAVQKAGLLLPLWIGCQPQTAPPLCGAIHAPDDYIAEAGELIAASVKAEEHRTWILMEVESYDKPFDSYALLHITEKVTKHIVCRSQTIPLPKYKANPQDSSSLNAIFTPGTMILCLFPQSTSFYPAVVKESPKTFKDSYLVHFDTFPSGASPIQNIQQRYVLSYRSAS
ncbi:SAGA-associated factor 29-like isoform X2 [Uloborus diversus]|uniref:SAGA-associated factor 29-like isoform X2 n=1 Tax=Uloborus diversus TaxID=327109 RepID=UPI00240A1539|nr:SAGA-associated factor 29-like isoform X2 [Uloborus diversus]